MKKYLLTILILLFTISSYSQEGKVVFKIKANYYYTFHIKLRGNCTQYLFRLKGTDRFNFRIIEPSGNEWQLHISDVLDNKIFLKENILDKGVYTIRVYSVADNFIEMEYNEY
jgi:hypothetical protein